jgi:hypothetical protein
MQLVRNKMVLYYVYWIHVWVLRAFSRVHMHVNDSVLISYQIFQQHIHSYQSRTPRISINVHLGGNGSVNAPLTFSPEKLLVVDK